MQLKLVFTFACNSFSARSYRSAVVSFNDRKEDIIE